ncbi:hypothetical protein D1007_05697 [Hordeum vulgare]|nr:hypothetical protein D1007_05697 [Hordeum vulgare]
MREADKGATEKAKKATEEADKGATQEEVSPFAPTPPRNGYGSDDSICYLRKEGIGIQGISVIRNNIEVDEMINQFRRSQTLPLYVKEGKLNIKQSPVHKNAEDEGEQPDETIVDLRVDPHIVFVLNEEEDAANEDTFDDEDEQEDATNEDTSDDEDDDLVFDEDFVVHVELEEQEESESGIKRKRVEYICSTHCEGDTDPEDLYDTHLEEGGDECQEIVVPQSVEKKVKRHGPTSRSHSSGARSMNKDWYPSSEEDDTCFEADDDRNESMSFVIPSGTRSTAKKRPPRVWYDEDRLHPKQQFQLMLCFKDVYQFREAKRQFGLEAPKMMAWRAKRKAKNIVLGDHKRQYKRLRYYLETVKATNPGSRCIVTTVSGKTRENPTAGPSGAQTLATTRRDANNNMYPIAFGVVGVEDTPNWSWFLTQLKYALGGTEEGKFGKYTFMSDRQKDLLNGVTTVFPSCPHRYYLRHIYANFQRAGLRGEDLKKCMDAAAYACTEHDFQLAMESMKVECKATWEWMSRIPPQAWSRHAMDTNCKTSLVVNNLSEVFSNYILDVRNKPIVTMINGIKDKFMVRSKQLPQDHVNVFFKKVMYLESYKPIVYPVLGPDCWVKTATPDIKPPQFKEDKKGPAEEKRKKGRTAPAWQQGGRSTCVAASRGSSVAASRGTSVAASRGSSAAASRGSSSGASSAGARRGAKRGARSFNPPRSGAEDSSSRPTGNRPKRRRYVRSRMEGYFYASGNY